MTIRTAAIAITLFACTIPAAQAEILLGGSRYPDSELKALQASCRGLEAQSRMSLTENVPDDIESSDPSSEYALSNLPFTLADCRRADLSR